MERGTCSEWLAFLDEMNPVDDAWRDPAFVQGVSWLLIMFLPRRLSQQLIDAQGGSAP